MTSGSGSSCPVFGSAEWNVSVKPGPVANLTTAGWPVICPDSSVLLVGTVTHSTYDSGPFSYLWYHYEAGFGGHLADTQRTNLEGTYYYIVTDSDGCAASSNTVTITYSSSCLGGITGGIDTGGGTGGGISGLGICPDPLTASFSCGLLTLAAPGYSCTPGWSALTPPSSGVIPALTNPATCSYDVPGIYWFRFTGTNGSCNVDTVIADTVGVAPNFRWQILCGTGGGDSVFLVDYTATLPWWGIDSVVWDTSGLRVGAGSSLHLYLPAPGAYTFTETIYGTMPDGPYACSSVQTINVPAQPSSISFVDSVSPICEGVPVYFRPLTTSWASSEWNFGDSSSSLLEYTKRTYKWSSTLGGGRDPNIYPVTLSITDTIGCSAIDSQTVLIYHNVLSGNLGVPSTAICSSDAPDTLNYFSITGTPISYSWYTGTIPFLLGTTITPTFNVYQSGAYWVTVFDIYQCQATLPSAPSPVKEVKIIKPPAAVIYGKNNYCSSDVVQLSGFLGNDVSYAWLQNSTADGATSSIADAGLAAGDYGYQLVIGEFDTVTGLTCYDTSAVDSVYMHPLPPAPTVTGPTVLNCNNYELELSASESEPGTFNWSDGDVGANDIIYSGGNYRAWFTDTNGCVNYTDTYVPLSPESYFAYFPSGCYSLCLQQLPLTLYGPPDVPFTYWAWLADGDTASSGSDTAMGSFLIDSPAYFQWAINNGLCTAQSDTMDVNVVPCNGCAQTVLSATVTCSPTNPACYTVNIGIVNGIARSTYVLGTNIGPMEPFSGTLPGGYYTPLTLTFTTLYLTPPDSVIIELATTLPDGTRCFQTDTVPLPFPCGWEVERQANTADSVKSKPLAISSALLVFPNPASGVVTVSYNYGTDSYKERSLGVYDEMGRTLQSYAPQDVNGNWTIDTKEWMPGLYIIRMGADGTTLQTQMLVITH